MSLLNSPDAWLKSVYDNFTLLITEIEALTRENS